MKSIKEILLGEILPLKLECECKELRFLEYSFESKLYKCKECGLIHDMQISKKDNIGKIEAF